MNSPFRTILIFLVIMMVLFSAQAYLPPQPAAAQCPLCGYPATQTAHQSLLTSYYATQQLTVTPEASPERLPTVHAVMFWMDGCPHCHYVLEEVLPPLQRQYGDQLEILQIELVSTEDVERLYQTAAAFGISKENVYVPFLVIGDRVLIGSGQIPAELPGLIEAYLAQGGVDYPRIEALSSWLPTSPVGSREMCAPDIPCTDTPERTPTATADPPPQMGSLELPRLNGFSLAITVLAGMLVALVYVGFSLGSELTKPSAIQPVARRAAWRDAAIAALCLAGLGVAGYLAYVEIQMAPAVCGPVGDCNAVQSSPYARLFGVLPVGLLGVAGYLAILIALAGTRLRRESLARFARLAVFGMAVVGVLFSLYLTYLEPFVIRAVCLWCLTSALILTLILLLSLPLARQALKGGLHG